MAMTFGDLKALLEAQGALEGAATESFPARLKATAAGAGVDAELKPLQMMQQVVNTYGLAHDAAIFGGGGGELVPPRGPAPALALPGLADWGLLSGLPAQPGPVWPLKKHFLAKQPASPGMASRVEAAPPILPPPLQGLIPLVLAALCGAVANYLQLEDRLAAIVGCDQPGDDGPWNFERKQRVATAALILLVYVNHVLGARVLVARRAHGVPHPFMYPHDANVKDPAAYMAVVRCDLSNIFHCLRF